MAEASINTSLAQKITVPDEGKVRKSCVGKLSSSKTGQNKLPDYGSSSTGSNHFEANSRRKSSGKLTTSNLRNTLPNHTRASIGSCSDLVNSRRKSSGKPSSSKSGESVAPNYLRASTGSCHFFCKYGRNDESEVKASRPMLNRVKKPPSDQQNPSEFGVPAERKTTEVVNRRPSFAKSSSHDSPGIIKQGVSPPSDKVEVSSRQGSTNDKKIAPKISSGPTSSNEQKIAHDEKKNNFYGKQTSVIPKTMVVKPSSSPGPSGNLNGRRNSEIKIAKRTGTSKTAAKKIHASAAASRSPKPSINRVMSLKATDYRSPKLVFPLKDQNRIRKAEIKQPKSEKTSARTLHVTKVETQDIVLESAQVDIAIPSQSPTLSSPKSSFLPTSPTLSFYKEEEQEEFECTDNDVKEADESISRSNETVTSLHKVETSEGNQKSTPKKALSDNKDCAPVKLKFRRGKVVDLQSENGSPRRLRFRQGRDIRKRSFKSRVENDTNSTNLESEKVVLRHQDVQDKKVTQVLFNNVIEETASKLVESRKSKVKALVGAFETVISLQEGKPQTQTVT